MTTELSRYQLEEIAALLRTTKLGVIRRLQRGTLRGERGDPTNPRSPWKWVLLTPEEYDEEHKRGAFYIGVLDEIARIGEKHLATKKMLPTIEAGDDVPAIIRMNAPTKDRLFNAAAAAGVSVGQFIAFLLDAYDQQVGDIATEEASE